LYPRRWTSSTRHHYFHFHQGIDVGAPLNTPIYSVTSGTVVHVFRDWEPYKLNKKGEETKNRLS